MVNDGLTIRIDGRQPLSSDSVGALATVCDRAEDRGEHGTVIVHVSGAPLPGASASEVTMALVSKWERALRRLERLPAATITLAEGDCGGLALEALLATDYRIARNSVRLLVTVPGSVIWPGMALYRLSHQAGAAAVRRAVLFGTPIDIAAALAMGLIDELAADATTAMARAAEVAEAVHDAGRAVRRHLMLDASATSFEESLGVHLAACDRVLRQAEAEVA
ncbi:MAG TPA: enoyl-CoA-hydratase DpgB [Streptosporangiaceae bacterium]